MKAAIIDLGSNSARMSIAELSPGGVKILENYRTVVRLSEGMGDEKMLKPEAVERTLDIIREFKKIIDENNISEVRAVATAALRTAANRELFTEPLKEIGIKFEIISGEKEAYYDYMAVVNTLNVKNGLIIDIGGASTELILLEDGINTEMVSIPMASVNITEKYFKNTVATDDETEYAVGKFTKQLEKISWLKRAETFDLIGLGGSVRAIAMFKNNTADLHGFSMTKEEVFELSAGISKMPIEERVKINGVGKGRADIILGGVVPLIAVMKYIGSEKLISCVTGLREGIMYDIVKK